MECASSSKFSLISSLAGSDKFNYRKSVETENNCTEPEVEIPEEEEEVADAPSNNEDFAISKQSKSNKNSDKLQISTNKDKIEFSEKTKETNEEVMKDQPSSFFNEKYLVDEEISSVAVASTVTDFCQQNNVVQKSEINELMEEIKEKEVQNASKQPISPENTHKAINEQNKIDNRLTNNKESIYLNKTTKAKENTLSGGNESFLQLLSNPENIPLDTSVQSETSKKDHDVNNSQNKINHSSVFVGNLHELDSEVFIENKTSFNKTPIVTTKQPVRNLQDNLYNGCSSTNTVNKPASMYSTLDDGKYSTIDDGLYGQLLNTESINCDFSGDKSTSEG